MNTNFNQVSGYSNSDYKTKVINSLVEKVYLWMTIALIITAGSSYLTVTSPTLMNMVYGSSYAIWILFGIELVIVFVMSGMINRLSTGALMTLFIIFSVLNGVTCSSIFLVFTKGSLVSTFLITSATFAVMSIYGYFTKEDLTKWGNILIMGLIGVVIASIVNLFMHSSTLYWIVTIIGIFVFVGLVAYDTQKIKKLGQMVNGEGVGKLALMGALTLYLDFINLFLLMLNLFGGRRQ